MIITQCRVCGNHELLPVLDLGDQALTCVFPKSLDEKVPSVPLELVKCSPAGCGLLQLRHTPDLGLMYGEGYGYRPGIRPFMVNHLRGKAVAAAELTGLKAGDIVVDIGSNDGTLLHQYPVEGLRLVGIDPSGEKFREHYPPAELVAEFFTREAFTERYGKQRAKVVTTTGMFYDIPDPLQFMQDIHAILDDDGVWMTEQSYMPAMLDANAYDVVCHEHLEYYGFQQIEWMAQKVGFTVLKAEVTDVYGGSLYVTLAKNPGRHPRDEGSLVALREREAAAGLDTMAPYEAFARRVHQQRADLRGFLDDSRAAGLVTFGYGASTKGNVTLQYCGIGPEDLPCIGEVSEEKAGRFTPGSGIPIVSEEEARSRRPDQLLVLPWIHRAGFVEREQAYLNSGGTLVFPMPTLTTVTA
ncbi:class I SAM-dependent methyltransferase [Streptomyces sp. NPDC056708]|uniref:class I SAM-dependent methyltransferase n=1 Tax=unclassified Streptomyces TaxID=2593676 RepID=UPI002E14E562|nr:class I SAM-dependent methyltransferase [Streptomyces sp. NBC_01224]